MKEDRTQEHILAKNTRLVKMSTKRKAGKKNISEN
jgi:hypothetical protein